MRVILKRGAKGDREFPHESNGRARQRAESLGWLHNVVPVEDGETIVVDATEYYTDREKRQSGEYGDARQAEREAYGSGY